MKTYGDYSQKVIARCQLLNSRGYGPKEIQKHMRDEGHRIPEGTIKNWLYSNTRAIG